MGPRGPVAGQPSIRLRGVHSENAQEKRTVIGGTASGAASPPPNQVVPSGVVRNLRAVKFRRLGGTCITPPYLRPLTALTPEPVLCIMSCHAGVGPTRPVAGAAPRPIKRPERLPFGRLFRWCSPNALSSSSRGAGGPPTEVIGEEKTHAYDGTICQQKSGIVTKHTTSSSVCRDGNVHNPPHHELLLDGA